jgi:hypothetical protein
VTPRPCWLPHLLEVQVGVEVAVLAADGAMMLSQAVDDSERSEDILAAARRRLTGPAGDSRPSGTSDHFAGIVTDTMATNR